MTMKLSHLDRSKYYRGLLVLVRKDHVVHRRERALLLQIGKLLDFDPRFCEAALDDLLKNPSITDEPVVFSSREIAECFITDALAVSGADDEIHPHELACLKSIALANGFADDWLDACVRLYIEKRSRQDLPPFPAVQQFL